MLKINIQLFGGRGARFGGSGGGTSDGGGTAVNTTDLVSLRETKQQLVDDTLTVFRDYEKNYGYIVEQISVAQMDSKGANTLAYWTLDNEIAVNEKYFNDNIEKAYANSVKNGFHPSNGNKTALQAVVAHEIGHGLTDKVAVAMGIKDMNAIDVASKRIMEEARQITGAKGVRVMAQNISGYATKSNAEAVAEAMSDYYCNGQNAKPESIAIRNVVAKYIGVAPKEIKVNPNQQIKL